jgi:hypothetical protein
LGVGSYTHQWLTAKLVESYWLQVVLKGFSPLICNQHSIINQSKYCYSLEYHFYGDIVDILPLQPSTRQLAQNKITLSTKSTTE